MLRHRGLAVAEPQPKVEEIFLEIEKLARQTQLRIINRIKLYFSNAFGHPEALRCRT